MADLLGLAARYIDEGVYEGPGSVNRTTAELSELGDGIALVEAFSHVVALRTAEGLVLFDTSLEAFAPRILTSLRRWSDARVHTIAYTHGHVDHVGGSQVFVDDARARGHAPPRFVAHENVAPRFARYALTNGWNKAINTRQFGRGGLLGAAGADFGPKTWVRPDTSFRERVRLRVGELTLELRHARGETDDHLYAWLPERKAIAVGDFVTWVFPNAGNPQKVQRYPLDWAQALREMSALGAELLLPAHGLPIAGAARIARVLDDVAAALEHVVNETLARMNAGETLDAIVQAVRVPARLLERPYLRPVYDEPEFVVRNVWRQYGGWYDGNPAHLKPAPAAAFARELQTLAGGVAPIVARARALASQGELRLACELVELAVQAEPESREAHGARAEIYAARRKTELSLMARGIFGTAAEESAAKVAPPSPTRAGAGS
jgi:alkyl sulfatase BDS1-like metallo-beta-lactamase superfamily hydrolase